MGGKVNKEIVRRAWILKREGYTQEEIAEKIGIASRTVQNYHSQEWLAERGLSYLQDAPVPERFPVMPLQQEAYDKCQVGDHSWMKGGRFDGLAFTTHSGRESQTDWKRVTSGAVGTKWQTKLCFFCGFESREHYWSGVVYVGEAPN